MKILLALALFLAGCGAVILPAQQSDDLVGKYLFKSHGWIQNHYAFFEAGVLTFQPGGHYSVESTYNANGETKHVSVQGTYILHGERGEMQSPGDSAVFYISQDRTLIFAVSTNKDSTWLVEAHKVE